MGSTLSSPTYGWRAFLQLINKFWEFLPFPRAGRGLTEFPSKSHRSQGGIAYLSLGKTAQKMVLNLLQWKLGSPREHLHGFTRGMSTAYSIATLLSTISTVPCVVVFLDLEKAFEPASPPAIQETQIQKGIRGNLLTWITIPGTE